MSEYTITQQNRLLELGVPQSEYTKEFHDNSARDAAFREIEVEYVKRGKTRLHELLSKKHAPDTWHIERALEKWLMDEEGFTRVSTPTIITSKMLSQMSIDDDNHLREQVFWLDGKKCLRPMLAPNLYVLMRDIEKITKEAVKIFEIGSCFRKESQGAQHMNEFTMLNFVELGSVADGSQMERLELMAKRAMEAVGIESYELVKEKSTVYEETLDIVVDDIEIASGSFGPHTLDANWGVFSTWVGLGIGIERVALVKNGCETIKRLGRSIGFLDGIPLNI